MQIDLLEKITTGSEQRLILSGVSWQQYETLRLTLDNFPGLRMTYLEGTLEIMTPSPEHEMSKTVIARLIERYADEMEINLNGLGSTTFRKEAKARGLEPDECYCVGEVKEIPDIAIEITISSGGIDKLAVYRGLGVPEVWFWQGGNFSLYRLREQGYEVIAKSEFIPELELSLLARYVRPSDQTQAVKDFLNAVRLSQQSNQNQ
jgi:Uma2 family endonuclease